MRLYPTRLRQHNALMTRDRSAFNIEQLGSLGLGFSGLFGGSCSIALPWLCRSSQVEGASDSAAASVEYVGVDHGRSDVLVAE